jgi:hypothetical protein
MNRNYLFKYELQYELVVRGITSAAEVPTLRMVFRSVGSAELPVDLN